MQPESMVHALEQIHARIVPDGCLVDIHPNGERAEFICRLGAGERLIGYLEESDGYLEYRQTDAALETVVARGLFRVSRAGEFEFRTYADSFDELEQWLSANWSDAIIPDEVAASASGWERDAGCGALFLRERVKISLLAASQEHGSGEARRQPGGSHGLAKSTVK